MRANVLLMAMMICCCVLGSVRHSYGQTMTWIRIGKYQTKITDIGDDSNSSGGGRTKGYYEFSRFEVASIFSAMWLLTTKDWVDPQKKTWEVKVDGIPQQGADPINSTMPLVDKDNVTLNRYFRYSPPRIIVDGEEVQEPFGFPGDAVAPNKIPGTADVMAESRFRTSMGLSVHQRVLAWSHSHHDDYIIFDWTFTNTGNVDLDPEIELPGQTLKGVYF